MKLAVAVLSSILFVCSVTTANPVNPSATKNTGASTSTFIPSENGIGLGALDPLPDNVKHLLDKYVEIQYARNQQKKIYWPLKSRHDSQYDVVMGVEKDLKILKYLSQDGDSPKYGEIQKTKLDHEKQQSKLDKILKSFDECQSKIGLIVEKKSETDKQIVRLILGTPLDLALFNYQALLIRGTPSVKDYIEKQSLKYKNLDGKSGGHKTSKSGRQSIENLVVDENAKIWNHRTKNHQMKNRMKNPNINSIRRVLSVCEELPPADSIVILFNLQ
ncbi:hypothetical protein QVD99_001367 [Batrachochytrium dendrobatidis]|nr:hypothetical protein QVD99_001367 [Batrachochytrium dendrobatidis]